MFRPGKPVTPASVKALPDEVGGGAELVVVVVTDIDGSALVAVDDGIGAGVVVLVADAALSLARLTTSLALASGMHRLFPSAT